MTCTWEIKVFFFIDSIQDEERVVEGDKNNGKENLTLTA